MSSSKKSRVHHAYRPDMQRKIVSVPVVKVSPEVANAIRRREGTSGIDYWNPITGGNGLIYRPVRRMTVEEAFPRLSVNGYDKSPKHLSSSLNPSGENGQYFVPVDPKKAQTLEFSSKDKTFYSDPSRNYHVYKAKIRYVESGSGKASNLGSKPSKSEKKKSEASKQNGQVFQQSVDYSNSKSQNGATSSNGLSESLPNYRIATPKDRKSKHRESWSEMTHMAVTGSLSKFPQPTFQKIGMNHTFRIPRPKATISRNSVIRGDINLTASKKRGVTFGQDKVYEYTPQEPLNHYPIHEELI